MINDNNITSAAIAIALSLAPQLMDKLAAIDLRPMYAKAQNHAAYILATGDVSELKEMEQAINEIHAVQTTIAPLEPVVKALANRIGPSFGLPNE